MFPRCGADRKKRIRLSAGDVAAVSARRRSDSVFQARESVPNRRSPRRFARPRSPHPRRPRPTNLSPATSCGPRSASATSASESLSTALRTAVASSVNTTAGSFPFPPYRAPGTERLQPRRPTTFQPRRPLTDGDAPIGPRRLNTRQPALMALHHVPTTSWDNPPRITRAATLLAGRFLLAQVLLLQFGKPSSKVFFVRPSPIHNSRRRGCRVGTACQIMRPLRYWISSTPP